MLARHDGDLRLIRGGQHCRPGEAKIKWKVAGKGAAGAPWRHGATGSVAGTMTYVTRVYTPGDGVFPGPNQLFADCGAGNVAVGDCWYPTNPDYVEWSSFPSTDGFFAAGPGAGARYWAVKITVAGGLSDVTIYANNGTPRLITVFVVGAAT